MPGAGAYAHAHGVDVGDGFSFRAYRKADHIPVKGTVFLDAPRIWLVGAVFGKGEGAEGNPAQVKILGTDFIALIEFPELDEKAQGAF